MSRKIPGRATVAVRSDIARLPLDHDRQQGTAATPADAAPERPARLSKAYPKHARTYTLLHQILPVRAITLPARPALRKAPSIVARKRHLIEQFQADLGRSGLCNKNIPLFLTLKSVALLCRPGSTRGACRDRHEREAGCGGRGSVGAEVGCRARQLVSVSTSRRMYRGLLGLL